MVKTPESVAITATTLYKDWYPGPSRNISHTDKIRGDLALESFWIAREIGYRVVVADGASSQSFKEELAKLDIIVLPRSRPKRAPGKRQIIQRASTMEGIEAIIRTEPEKVSLVENCAQTITLPLLSKSADIVVPKRNEALFAQHYPDYMFASEIDGNMRFNRVLQRAGLLKPGQQLDVMFGPNAFRNSPEVISLFMEVYDFQRTRDFGIRKYANPEEACDAQIFPVIKALRLGLKVKSVEVPFIYPKTQRENETTDDEAVLAGFLKKRAYQRMGFISEIVHFIRLLSTDENIKRKSLIVPVNVN